MPAATAMRSRAGSVAIDRSGAGLTVNVTVTVRVSAPSTVTTPVYWPGSRLPGNALMLTTAGVTALANDASNHGASVRMATFRLAGVLVISTFCGAVAGPPEYPENKSASVLTRNSGAAPTCIEKLRTAVWPD